MADHNLADHDRTSMTRGTTGCRGGRGAQHGALSCCCGATWQVVEADEALNTAREKFESIADAIHAEADDFQRRAGADFSKGLKARHVSITRSPRVTCHHALATCHVPSRARHVSRAHV